MTARRRLAILGAGPVGLEAAARAVAEGWDTCVLEAGEPAEHVRRWGHVRLFTPFGMNAGTAGLELLRTAPGNVGDGPRPPAGDARLTGTGLRDRYLLPLARALSPHLELRTGTHVLSVSRSRLLKGESIGDEARAEDPFRILVERDGVEEERQADVVLDCTGTYGRPNWMGPAGTPALGERALAERIEYGLPDVAGRDRERYAGRRTLVVGGGHSAATTVLALAELADREPATRFLWLTRTPPGGLHRVPDDPLPARDALVRRANALSGEAPEGSAWRGGARVLAVEPAGERLRVTFEAETVPAPEGTGKSEAGDGPPGAETVQVDGVVANVGHEPDDGLYRQLLVHECYASRGPMKLAAALLGAAGDGPADCLELGGFGPEVLRNPEPRFFILGMKSYGRNGAFLLRTGYEQVEDVFSLLASDGAREGTGTARAAS